MQMNKNGYLIFTFFQQKSKKSKKPNVSFCDARKCIQPTNPLLLTSRFGKTTQVCSPNAPCHTHCICKRVGAKKKIQRAMRQRCGTEVYHWVHGLHHMQCCKFQNFVVTELCDEGCHQSFTNRFGSTFARAKSRAGNVGWEGTDCHWMYHTAGERKHHTITWATPFISESKKQLRAGNICPTHTRITMGTRWNEVRHFYQKRCPKGQLVSELYYFDANSTWCYSLHTLVCMATPPLTLDCGCMSLLPYVRFFFLANLGVVDICCFCWFFKLCYNGFWFEKRLKRGPEVSPKASG